MEPAGWEQTPDLPGINRCFRGFMAITSAVRPLESNGFFGDYETLPVSKSRPGARETYRKLVKRGEPRPPHKRRRIIRGMKQG